MMVTTSVTLITEQCLDWSGVDATESPDQLKLNNQTVLSNRTVFPLG